MSSIYAAAVDLFARSLITTLFYGSLMSLPMLMTSRDYVLLRNDSFLRRHFGMSPSLCVAWGVSHGVARHLPPVCVFFPASSAASVRACLEGYSFCVGCYILCTSLVRMISFSYAVVLELFSFVYSIIYDTAPS